LPLNSRARLTETPDAIPLDAYTRVDAIALFGSSKSMVWCGQYRTGLPQNRIGGIPAYFDETVSLRFPGCICCWLIITDIAATVPTDSVLG